MRKLRTYWFVLVNSCTSPEYYFAVLRTRVRFSVQFFLVSLIFLALFSVVRFQYRIFPDLTASAARESSALLAQLPNSFAFIYTGKEAQITGTTLPYTLKASQTLQDAGYPEQFLTLTSASSPTPSPTESFLTLGAKALIISPDGTQANSIPYSDILGSDPFEVNKAQLLHQRESLLARLSEVAGPLAVAYAVSTFFLHLTIGLFTILFYSIIVQTFGWLFGVRVTYKQTLHWGLHLYPIAQGIQDISGFLTPTVDFPLFTLAYFALALSIIWYARRHLRPQNAKE